MQLGYNAQGVALLRLGLMSSFGKTIWLLSRVIHGTDEKFKTIPLRYTSSMMLVLPDKILVNSYTNLGPGLI